MARSSAEVNMDNGWYGWWCHKCQNAAMRNNKSLLTKLYILHDIMYSNIPVNQDKWHYFHGNYNIVRWTSFNLVLTVVQMHTLQRRICKFQNGYGWSNVLWWSVTRLLLVLLVLRFVLRWLEFAMSMTSLKAVRLLWNNEVALGRKQTFFANVAFSSHLSTRSTSRSQILYTLI